MAKQTPHPSMLQYIPTYKRKARKWVAAQASHNIEKIGVYLSEDEDEESRPAANSDRIISALAQPGGVIVVFTIEFFSVYTHGLG